MAFKDKDCTKCIKGVVKEERRICSCVTFVSNAERRKMRYGLKFIERNFKTGEIK